MIQIEFVSKVSSFVEERCSNSCWYWKKLVSWRHWKVIWRNRMTVLWRRDSDWIDCKSSIKDDGMVHSPSSSNCPWYWEKIIVVTSPNGYLTVWFNINRIDLKKSLFHKIWWYILRHRNGNLTWPIDTDCDTMWFSLLRHCCSSLNCWRVVKMFEM